MSAEKPPGLSSDESAPRVMRKAATAASLRCAATISGVIPSALRASTSRPASSRRASAAMRRVERESQGGSAGSASETAILGSEIARNPRASVGTGFSSEGMRAVSAAAAEAALAALLRARSGEPSPAGARELARRASRLRALPERDGLACSEPARDRVRFRVALTRRARRAPQQRSPRRRQATRSRAAASCWPSSSRAPNAFAVCLRATAACSRRARAARAAWAAASARAATRRQRRRRRRAWS
jgi:hypothetical protein